MKFLADQLRSELVAKGVVRESTVAGSLPVAFADRPDGTPPPVDSNGDTVPEFWKATPAEKRPSVVVHLARNNAVPPQPFGEFVEQALVDVTIRAVKSSDAQATAQRIIDELGARHDPFTCAGGLVVNSCRLWRGVQRYPVREGMERFGVIYGLSLVAEVRRSNYNA